MKAFRNQNKTECDFHSPCQDKVVTGADVTQNLAQLILQLNDGPNATLDRKHV